ncbi:MAG: V-type ATP synthase subunit E [bacterium]
MTPIDQNDGESLCLDILKEAQAEAERLVARARQDAESLLTTTRAAGEKAGQERLDAVAQECARRKEKMRASLPVDYERLRAACIETLLNVIHDDIRNRLLKKEGFDYRETLVALAATAIDRMDGTEFEVALSPGDHDLIAHLETAILQHTLKTGLEIRVVSDPAIQESGLIIRDRAGRQLWDNRLTARLDRCWPELRLRLAAMIPGVLKPADKGAPPHDALTP